MTTPDAIRSRHKRLRRQVGARCYIVCVPEVDTIEMLLAAGVLHPNDQENEDEIGWALSRLIGLLAHWPAAE